MRARFLCLSVFTRVPPLSPPCCLPFPSLCSHWELSHSLNRGCPWATRFDEPGEGRECRAGIQCADSQDDVRMQVCCTGSHVLWSVVRLDPSAGVSQSNRAFTPLTHRVECTWVARPIRANIVHKRKRPHRRLTNRDECQDCTPKAHSGSTDYESSSDCCRYGSAGFSLVQRLRTAISSAGCQ